jgi:hypothetical protein
MAKLWARIVMGLIFVFATISSPLHAQAASPAEAHTPVAASMDGMSAACAKAMAAEAGKTKMHKPAPGHAGGCCASGCNCPLSHCPATPPALAAALPAPAYDGAAVLAERTSATLVSVHADTLIRPPRA